MTPLPLNEAQSRPTEIVHRIGPGEEILITENDQPVAKIVGELRAPRHHSRASAGALKGMVTYVADDFDAPLPDMREYME